MAYDPRLDPNNSEYDPDYAATQPPPEDTPPPEPVVAPPPQQPAPSVAADAPTMPKTRGPADPVPDAVWQDYAHTAIRTLYPHLTDGVDYMWGRRDVDSPPELIYWNDKKFPAADLGKIEEVATAMMNGDPYRAGGYVPKPTLHGGSVLGQGEVPKYERAQDQPEVTQQPYIPPPV